MKRQHEIAQLLLPYRYPMLYKDENGDLQLINDEQTSSDDDSDENNGVLYIRRTGKDKVATATPKTASTTPKTVSTNIVCHPRRRLPPVRRERGATASPLFPPSSKKAKSSTSTVDACEG